MADISREDLDDLIESLKQANLVTDVYERTAEILQRESYNERVRRYRSRVSADPGASADH